MARKDMNILYHLVPHSRLPYAQQSAPPVTDQMITLEQLQETHPLIDQQPAEIPASYAAEQQRHLERERRMSERITQLEALLRHKERLLEREHAERTKAEQTRQYQTFLAEISRLLAASLDYTDTLSQVARLITAYLATWCTIDLVTPDGQIRQAAAAHRLPRGEQLLHELVYRYPIDPHLPHPVLKVIQTGQPEIMPDISDIVLEVYTRDEEHQRILHELGTRSAIIVPLMVRGRVLGALLLASQVENRYQTRDLALVEDLAYRITMAVDNAQLYQKTQEAIHVRDQFLSIAAHELKTPLTTLLGYATLLAHRVNPTAPLTEREQRALQAIITQTKRFNELIEALLNLSRFQTGHFNIQQTLLDFGTLVRQVVEEMQPALEQHTIVFTAAEAPVFIDGDAVALRQVIRNLLQNAVKYSPHGGMIAVQVEGNADKARLTVADEGIGIPEKALPQLFEGFYRAPNAVAQQVGGMGVGLYVVKEIVTLHSGTVTVESHEGEGSTFTISFPVTTMPLQERMCGEG